MGREWQKTSIMTAIDKILVTNASLKKLHSSQKVRW
jgi:hypothetical protein